MIERDAIEKLIETHKRTLRMLEQQQAEFGQFCPPYIVVGIQDAQTKIAELDVQLGRSVPGEAQSNLPPLPYFFGRERELTRISEALGPDMLGWGMLIDGPGGIGKTFLAIQAADKAPAERFPRKIFLTAKVRELTTGGAYQISDFTTPDFMAVLAELGRELGDKAIGKSEPAERPKLVRERLARERALIVFDNLETLSEPERVQLFQFLDRLPRTCKALVTSRRRDDTNARSLRLDRLSRRAALELIGELELSNSLLARATPIERDELYAATQGNPLLIRWVAGQIGRIGSRCRTVADACDFLKHAPANNDPLEYIFGDVIDTLTPNETEVLVALAHFKEPAQVAWVAEIGSLVPNSAQNALDDLCDRAVLNADAERTAFVLPDLATVFVRRRLPELVALSGERLAAYAVTLIEENGNEQHAHFPALEAAWPLIAAALPLFLEGDNARLQTSCEALGTFLHFSGRWDAWLQLNEAAEVRALTADDFDNAGQRAYDLGWISSLHDQALSVLQAAERAGEHWSRANAGERKHAFAIQLRGIGYALMQDYPAALAAYQQVVDLDRSLKLESRDVAIDLNDLASAKCDSGDYTGAERDYREALRIAHTVNYREGVAYITGNLAALALELQDWAAAEALARTALQCSEEIGRQELIASTCMGLANALILRGKPQDGLPYAQRAVKIYTQLSSPDLKWAQQTLQESMASRSRQKRRRSADS